MNRDLKSDRVESARLSARLEKLREEFDQRLAAKDLALADQERVIVRLEAEVARLRAAIGETLCDDEPCARCRHLREALNGGESNG